jgi:hypothetical protein
MSDDPDMKLAHYEATLRNAEMNWRAKFDFILHTERVAAEIGIGAVRTAILINAGALVSLLALVGQLWDKDKGHTIVSHVLHAGAPFVWGLVSAAASFTVAYFYQSSLTKKANIELATLSHPSTLPSHHWVRWFTPLTAIVMVLLAFVSLGAFVWGIFAVMNVFQTST